MGYVVVVLALVNVSALCGMGWVLWRLRWDTMVTIGTTIAEELRKQDDRIEKRLERREDKVATASDAPEKTMDGVMRVGQPYRR